MRPAVVIGGLVGVAALGAGLWFGARGDLGELKDDVAVKVAVAQTGKAPAAHELAPQSLFYYVEMRNLRSRWDQVTASGSWKDLESSNVLAVIGADERVKAFLDGLHELAEKAEMPVTRDNLMKFLGRETALGLALNPDAGSPDVLLVTRLDVEALTRDMLNGEGDWSALQDELNRRQGNLEMAVTTEEYGDYKIATAVKDDLTIVSTQIEDTLVLATRRDLVTACLDARAGAGAGSLSKLPEFTQEMAALPGGSFARGWLNFQRLDVQRQLLAESLSGAGAPEHAVAGLTRVLDATKGRGALGMAIEVPDGDLYGLRFDRLSKGGDALFNDPARPDLRAIVTEDAMLYAELRDLKGVHEAWNRSEVKRRLLDSHLWRQGEEAAGTGLGAMAGGGGRPFPMDGQEPPPAPPKIQGPFLPRFLGRVALGQLGALLSGRGALSVSWDAETEKHPRVDAAVRLDVAGRLAFLMAEGSTKHRILNDEIRDAGMADHRGRTILLAMDGVEPVFAMALAGDTLFGSTDVARLKTLLDGADFGAGEGARPAVDMIARGGFGDDFRAFLHVDGDRWREQLAKWLDKASEQDSEMSMMAGLLDNSLPYAGYAAALYVDERFTRLEVRHAVTSSAKTSASAKALLTDPGSGELRSWKFVPETAFLWAGNRLDLEAYWELIQDSIPGQSRADVEEALKQIEEPLEMSVVKDIIPAFGPEFGVAVLHGKAPPMPQGAPPDATPPPAIPGVTVSLQVRNDAAARRLVDRLFEMGNEASRERFAQEQGDPPAPDLFVRESYQDVQYITTALTDRDKRGVPPGVQPALAFHDGFLTVTLNVDTLRAIVDVGKRKGKSLRDTEFVGRVARGGSDLGARGLMLFDWNGFVDQLGEYSIHFGEFVPEAQMPEFPEYPENGDDKEWARRLEVWEQKRAEGAKRGASAVGKYLESLRLMDYMAATAKPANGMETGSFVIRFPE